MGNTIESTIELSSRVGARGPRIDEVRQERAKRSNHLVIQGENLSGPDLAVVIAGSRAGIRPAHQNRIVALAPPMDVSGTIRVFTREGEAVAPRELVAEVTISVTPTSFTLPAGEETQLAAIVTGLPNAKVQWRIRGSGAAGVKIGRTGRIDARRATATGRIQVTARVAGRRLRATTHGEIVCRSGRSAAARTSRWYGAQCRRRSDGSAERRAQTSGTNQRATSQEQRAATDGNSSHQRGSSLPVSTASPRPGGNPASHVPWNRARECLSRTEPPTA